MKKDLTIVSKGMLDEKIVERQPVFSRLVEDHTRTRQPYGHDLAKAPRHFLTELILSVQCKVVPDGVSLDRVLPDIVSAEARSLGLNDGEAPIAKVWIGCYLVGRSTDKDWPV